MDWSAALIPSIRSFSFRPKIIAVIIRPLISKSPSFSGGMSISNVVREVMSSKLLLYKSTLIFLTYLLSDHNFIWASGPNTYRAGIYFGDYKFLWRTPRTSIIWDQRRHMVLPVGGRYLWEYPVLRLQRDSSAANVMICDWCVEIMVALGRKTANSHRSQRPQLHVLDTQKCCIFFFRKLIFVCFMLIILKKLLASLMNIPKI